MLRSRREDEHAVTRSASQLTLAVSALQFTSVRNPIARSVVATIAGLLVTATCFVLLWALMLGFTYAHVFPDLGLASVVETFLAALVVCLPLLTISIILIFERLSPPRSSKQSVQGSVRKAILPRAQEDRVGRL